MRTKARWDAFARRCETHSAARASSATTPIGRSAHHHDRWMTPSTFSQMKITHRAEIPPTNYLLEVEQGG
jgi:hypothetical protein